MGVIQIKYTSKPNSLISGIDTATILNLGDHGFADSFFFEKDYNKAGESVPLVCQLDKVTGLIQLLNLLISIFNVEENNPKKYKPNILKSCHKVASFVLPVLALH